jgi:hypothetical protein
VQQDTHVTIEGDCQIGTGYAQMDDDGKYLDELATPVTHMSVNRRYTSEEWAAGHLITSDSDPTALQTLAATYYKHSLPECASWKYKSPYAFHDIYANKYDSKGGALTATNGHTFYGNVFGGGSGYFPSAAGKWHWKAGNVGGDTYVTITGGHILTNVYGGNEMTNVDGDCTVNMSGGTIGVPRTLGQIAAHPVTCYLFGGGAGDARVLFNKQTNVKNAVVNVTGGTIYGSVLGGGEDGHVMRNVTMNIGVPGKDAVGTEGEEGYEPAVAATGPTIGTWGTSGLDGNVFGGGRGFTGDAYTAGNVAGSVTLNIKGGTMLGSVYGGGRLGSVGYGLYEATETEAATTHKMYGEMQDDGYGDWYKNNSNEYVRDAISNFKRGHVEINISGGTIGNDHEYVFVPSGSTEADLASLKNANYMPNTKFVFDKDMNLYRLSHTKGGNVYAGGMGRLYLLDGTTPISAVDWWKLGNVKSTKLTITGGTIKSNVYGGGELGWTQGMHTTTGLDATDGVSTEILIQDGTIGTEIKETVPGENEGDPSTEVMRYTFGSVYGGGFGDDTEKLSNETNPKFIAGRVTGSTWVKIEDGVIKGSVFGGGEMANVGLGFYAFKSTIPGGTTGGYKLDDAGIAKTGETITDADIARISTYVDINGGSIGYPGFGGATMGNVFGGGSGSRSIVRCGLVLGNTNVNISQAEGKETKIYHTVYGGGSFGSVGDYEYNTYTDTDLGTVKVKDVKKLHKEGTGTIGITGTTNIKITGGTIGDDGYEDGMVFGSSRGDIYDPHERDNWNAWVNDTHVTIGTEGDGANYDTPHIKGSVYGGGENGHTLNNTEVTVNSGTIGMPTGAPVVVADPDYPNDPSKATTYYGANYPSRGNVFGGGCGTDTYEENGEVKYNPQSGIVRGNTTVNITGGLVSRSVYGAGSMGSVGTIAKDAEGNEKITKHESIENGFGLSWPYKFEFAENTGKATINITGGHIGVQLKYKEGEQDIEIKGDGDVFGSARGTAGDRYTTALLAYVNETEVNVDYSATASMADVKKLETPCVTGSVSGSGEDGYVYGDTHVTLNNGLIGHSLYGGGKGKGTYQKELNKLVGEGKYNADIYSLIAGKVFGNTYVTMKGGYVGRNVYGGGNMSSVGKGSFAGGADDYVNDCTLGAEHGYGEKITGNLWDGVSDDSKAFLGSGKTTVNVISGTVGYIDESNPENSMKNELPYGNVIGGSAGEAAPNIAKEPRYEYTPAFFSGYVNETDVTIGGYRCKTAYGDYKVNDCITAEQYNALTDNQANWELVGPTIYASVYGGGQDGHVRRDTKVTVIGGEIGKPYNSTNISLLKTNDLDDPQWLHRGNIYGGGSGITKYKYDFDGDGKTDKNDGSLSYNDKPVKEEDYSNSSGSVTRFTEVNILGGVIHRNVYGGGSMGSVGAPNMGQTYDPYKKDLTSTATLGKQSQNTVNISGTVGTPYDTDKGWTYNQNYGGEVYGASRGMSSLDSNEFSNSVWTQVNVLNGAIIMGNVYGGGDSGIVKKDTEVNIGEAANP